MEAPMYDLKGKAAIITGGGNGIGRAIGLRLADEGADIGIFDIDDTAAEKTAADIKSKGRSAHVVSGSVAKKSDVERGMATLIQRLGKIDILINNAGILRVGTLLAMSEEDWISSFQVNVDSVFLVSRAVIPHMVARKSGCVLNLASWLGKKGIANYSAYCATKFAIVGLTQAMAAELADQGIRVNAVAPGLIVDTKMREQSEALHRAHGLPLAAERINTIPLKRFGYPDDVARVAAFLVSNEASYMTGQAVNVGGGLWTN
jgi:NAD(P)-dependent dehydrogenase (short-subunit alcohol dehydrogenase family)